MKYFGTDGIRGKYGGFEISETFFYALGRAAARVAAEDNRNEGLVAGGDTRVSTGPLKDAFCRGLRSLNAKVSDLGVLPTPALAYAVLNRKAFMGAMITASHNPYTDNGIKFFNDGALKIEDELQLRLEEHLDAELPAAEKIPPPKRFKPGKIKAGEFALNEYVQIMSSIFPGGFLKGVKIALDMANGATSGVSSKVFSNYGATVVESGCNPDGFNINSDTGSQYPEKVSQLCIESGSDLGFAHDGDGDRLVVCDELGSILEGEEIMALIAEDALERGTLKGGIVTTLQSNLGLDEFLAKKGVKVFRTGIGDRLVMREMIARSCNMGGENSGHFIFSEVSPCGDGLAAALSVLSVLSRKKKKLSELRNGVEMYPSESAAIPVAEKIPIEDSPNLSKAVSDGKEILGGEGRILVRYSGTENKIRLLVEGKDSKKIADVMRILKRSVELDLM